MFSGGDSSGDGVNLNFQLSSQSSAACGINTTSMVNGSIDWASLAQQWIQMRDYSGIDIGTSSPPSPVTSANILNVTKDEKKTFEEHGVADMEMDEEEDNECKDTANLSSKPHEEVQQTSQSKWFPQQSSVPPFCNTTIIPQPPASSQWNSWQQRILLSSPVLNTDATSPTAHIPSLMKINIPDPNIKSKQETSIENISTMDAAKKKILPAWIREGLEKMEREKQKQKGKEENKKEILDSDVNSKRIDTSPLSSGHMVKNKNINILESGSSGNEEDAINERASPAVPGTSKGIYNVDEDCPKKSGKNYEQKLSDLMIVVRKTLTELLLEVTNEEIFGISQDVIKAYKKKATSAQVIPKSDISTITGKLEYELAIVVVGLAAYDDSSEDTSDSETEKLVKKEVLADSEEDIKNIIRTKRKSFLKTAEEIEERIAECAFREEQKLKYYSLKERLQIEESKKLQKQRDLEVQHDTAFKKYCVDTKSTSINFKGSDRDTDTSSLASGKGYERDFGETSESKLQISNNGKRQKERTTRFSDNKDTKLSPIVSNNGYISQIKCNQIETAVQKINSTLLKVPIDDSSSYQTVVHRPVVEKTYRSDLNYEIDISTPKKQRKFRQSSESSSHSTESSETSNRTANSSKNSYHSKRSRSTKKHQNNRHNIHSGGPSRHNHRSSNHKYQSSDSDHSGEDQYHYRKNRYSRRSSRSQNYERNKRTRTRSRSRSLSKCHSKYSSSRHRH